jgi:hypothetical protein
MSPLGDPFSGEVACMFRAWTLAVAIVALAVLPQVGHGQSFSFSIGSGHHHGHHHHGAPHCWHDHWCGPHIDYLYVYPRPVVRQHITYVQPAVTETYETRVAPPAGQAWTGRTGSTQSTTAAAPVAAASPLQIWNAAGRQARVSFLVNGQEVTLSDGQSHTVYAAGTRVIEFDRGGDFGTARYDLSGGEYEFVVSNNGWDLVEKRAAGGNVATRPVLKKNTLPAGSVQR